MHNYLYQITNIINNKIYIGVHKTDNIDDGYMGSGKVIKSAIEKYGIENFRKDILEHFDTYEKALAKEAEIVTDEFLQRDGVYNLRRGGTGGFDYINRTGLNQKNHNEWNKIVSSVGCLGGKSTATKKINNPEEWNIRNLKISTSRKGSKGTFTGMSHTVLSKSKISSSMKGKQTGDKNSQHGKCWITNGYENKKINKDDIDIYLTEGWRKGRIML